MHTVFRRQIGVYINVIFSVFIVCCPLGYAGVGTAFDNIVRTLAKVSDEVPIRKAEGVVEKVGASRAMKESADEALGISSKEATRSTEAILRRIMGGGSDSALVKELDELPEATWKARLVQIKGAKELGDVVPDIATRGRLLANGGEDALLAAGTQGRGGVTAMMEFDEIVRTGQMTISPGMREVTTTDLAKVFIDKGKAGLKFWNDTVRPNWKKFAVGGVIAWWVINPDGFMDTMGNVTKEGAKRIGELTGIVMAAAAQGTAEGGGNAIRKIIDAIKNGALASWQNTLGFVILVLVAFVVLVNMSASAAKYLLAPFRVIWKCLGWVVAIMGKLSHRDKTASEPVTMSSKNKVGRESETRRSRDV